MHARAQRLARGWIVGLVATTVAAVSHSLAGGYRPGILSFGAALVFAGLLGTAVIGCRPSLPRLSIAVGVSQLAFHLLFSVLGSGGSISGGGGGGVSTASGSRMSDMNGMGGAGSTALAASGHDHLADPSMWIAHALAAALTILFLRHAELAVWGMLTRLVTLVIARIAAVVAPIVCAEGPQFVVGSPETLPLRARLLIASARRRGPPLLAF